MYLMRLDDASEHWNKENWHRIHDLLKKYSVKPIVAIIPHNEDPRLVQYSIDNGFINTIQTWIKEGWLPALHGYNHVMDSSWGGVNPVNQKSEFAGKVIDIQREKIRNGINILHSNFIFPQIFVAPAHSFDNNTLEALRMETDIRIISDTIANDIYYQDGFYYIPQQSGKVRNLRLKCVTFCCHPNDLKDNDFDYLESFLLNNQEKFTCFQDIVIRDRPLSLYDKLVRALYFAKRKIHS